MNDDLKSLAKLVLPLLLIPVLMYPLSFGHEIQNLVIALVFVFGMISTQNIKHRRLMIVMAVFATIFESINVLTGAYVYTGAQLVPIWIGIGWGVLGRYLTQNIEFLKKVPDNISYILAVAIYSIIGFSSGFSLSAVSAVVFAILGVFVLRISSKYPASFFLLSGVSGMIIEIFGTTFGAWKYFDSTGAPISVPLVPLAFSYAAVMGFCAWICGVEND